MRRDCTDLLKNLLQQRILILDGAMGTMIQRYKLSEADYRGERFKDWASDLKGNNDLVTLTQPKIIRDIHAAYLDAGADILETNTFNATSIAMADYQMEALVYELNLEAAKLARGVADVFEAKLPNKPRFVAGALGPTNRTASISPDVNNPGFRGVTFDELVEAYSEQTRGLIAVGLTAPPGAELMRPYLAEIAAVADTLTIAYPNAGLPNAMGEYDEGPHDMACPIEPGAK